MLFVLNCSHNFKRQFKKKKVASATVANTNKSQKLQQLFFFNFLYKKCGFESSQHTKSVDGV